ncbi:MAG TPA: VWA domain-containing protein [Pyrinomonadaceae bacterium]|nr:VWA domain-containing protein [Pyrinomonadaceae bacterium]
MGSLRQRTWGIKLSLLLAALLALSNAVPVAPRALPRAAGAAPQASEPAPLSLALEPGGEVYVENRQGGVSVQIWDGAEVLLLVYGPGALVSNAKPAAKGRGRAARGKAGAARSTPPLSIERGQGSLRIVARAPSAPAPQLNIRLIVPVTARLKVYTSGGAFDLNGLPAALDAQTLSGDMRLELPASPDASLTAQSLNGSVALARGVESPRADARVLSGKFQTRWGAGGGSVNLFSGRGRISLEAPGSGQTVSAAQLNEDPTEHPPEVEATPRPTADAPRRGAVVRRNRVRETQEDAPVLTTQRPRPQPTETPQEVDEDEVVRVESDLVTLNVSVIDRASGRGLQGLTAEDFRVYEDNVEQHVEHFETAEAPFDLLLLLDLSGSTARVTDTIRAAARRFVSATRPQDRVGIIAFAGETSVVSPLTSDRAALRSSLDRLAKPAGDTRFYDSLAYALDYMTRGADPARRRAVIVMSDGLDSTLPNVTGVGSTLPYNELRSRVQEFEGVVYSVWTNTEFYEAFSPLDIQPETYDLAHDRMSELAEAGGGLFYEVEKLEDLAGAYERVVADLGTVYGLSYRPTNKLRDGSWRAIRVRLPRRPEAVARGRRGYYAK